MIALIVTPERYDGSPIRTIGFLRLEFEGDAIFTNKSDADHRASKNGVWISAENIAENRKRELSNRYVLVEGQFSAQMLGHMGAFSGAITNITRMVPFND